MYLEHWDSETQTQSWLECYQALNRWCELAEYLNQRFTTETHPDHGTVLVTMA